MRVVLDIENTVTFRDDYIDGSPYAIDNKLVMVQYHVIDTDVKGYILFNHAEYIACTGIENSNMLQDLLNSATEVIGHNLKHDFSWLYECGFTYAGKLYDTMAFEYVNARGKKIPLSLHACCERYGLSAKLGTMDEYLNKGINVDAIPLAELVEYGMQDIQSTLDLYLYQQDLLAEDKLVASMWPAIQLTNETLPVIIEMERNGCRINLDTLHAIEQEYITEKNQLEHTLNNMVAEVMGDTPINLQSPEDLCSVIYSRKVRNKKIWATTFNLGLNERGKRKRPRPYPKSTFKDIIVRNMETVYRTESYQCETCYGKGKVHKTTKKGVLYKKPNICKTCTGAGFVYIPTNKVAGYRIQPIGSSIVTANGFATDKKTVALLHQLGKLNTAQKEFLDTLVRLNAVTTYLNTFIEGIKNNTREDNLLHTSLNQFITNTGRLSSSNPNFQNLPRAKTFPVRKCIVSRFPNGKILEVDWSALEYRVAVLLSNDIAGMNSILKNIDRHSITRDILTSAGQIVDRQAAKPHTFKPLYGGTSGTEAEQAYYRSFTAEHRQLYIYQQSLCTSALENGYIQSPSGRVYAFPDTRRISADRVTNQTQIYNYCIQGFATADIMPCALIVLYRLMKEAKVQSKLILTVHDSVEIDVHPKEVDKCIELVYTAFSMIEKELKCRFNFECCVPLDFEISIGDDWMNKEEIHYEPCAA